jgi:hypothetical protein
MSLSKTIGMWAPLILVLIFYIGGAMYCHMINYMKEDKTNGNNFKMARKP